MQYGRIKDIDVKMPARPPAFAFVAFMDARGNVLRFFLLQPSLLETPQVASQFLKLLHFGCARDYLNDQLNISTTTEIMTKLVIPLNTVICG